MGGSGTNEHLDDELLSASLSRGFRNSEARVVSFQRAPQSTTKPARVASKPCSCRTD